MGVSGTKVTCSVRESPSDWRSRVGFIRLPCTEAGIYPDWLAAELAAEPYTLSGSFWGGGAAAVAVAEVSRALPSAAFCE